MSQKQKAADKFRDMILGQRKDFSSDTLQILIKRQTDLWAEELDTAKMFAKRKLLVIPTTEGQLDETEDEEQNVDVEAFTAKGYAGGKWGRFLRAPEFYFALAEKYHSPEPPREIPREVASCRQT